MNYKKYIFSLLLMVPVSICTQAQQSNAPGFQVVLRLAPSTDIINSISDEAMQTGQRLMNAADSNQPLSIIADCNIALDRKSLASFKSADVGYNGSINETFSIRNKIYQVPTEEQMAVLIPKFHGVPVRFDDGSKVEKNPETVQWLSGQKLSCYSDYKSNGRNIVYALRFKGLDEKGHLGDRSHLYAYRYLLNNGMLSISAVFVGDNPKIKNVKDVDDENWWSSQKNAYRRYLPLTGNCTEYLLRNSSSRVVITPQTMDITDHFVPVPACVRPYYDRQASVDSIQSFIHYDISGENVAVNRLVDPSELTIEPVGAHAQIFVRSNPEATSLEYEGGDFPYGKISNTRKRPGTTIYDILFNKNTLDTARTMTFLLKMKQHPNRDAKITVTQPGLDIPDFTDSIPADYLSEENVSDTGSWKDTKDDNFGYFSFEDAVDAANIEDENGNNYHLPTQQELTCILPQDTIMLNEPVHEVNKEENISFGEYQDYPVVSKYYGKGDGTLYAFRYKDDNFHCAFRYRFVKGEGLHIDILPYKTTKDFSMKDLEKEETFERKDVYRFLLPACGGNGGEDYGNSGELWTSTKVASNLAVAYFYNDEMIGSKRESTDAVLAVRPFIGEQPKIEEFDQPAVQHAAPRVIKRRAVAPDRRRVAKPKARMRRPAPNHNSSGNSRNNHILIIDKTK